MVGIVYIIYHFEIISEKCVGYGIYKTLIKLKVMKNLNWTEKMMEVLENSPFETIELESSTNGLITYKHKYKGGYLQWIITHYRHLGKLITEIGFVSDLKRGSWGCKVTGRNTIPNRILEKMIDIVNNPYKYK